ncbi:hypothetical protein JAAARDRAFT_39821 [Jaapia argillacea MUCL 33604]|uniref:Uncharacterized protein n=1 Tax=Jaapia argillacea MUCL 33604 TaxID=933084 RepID=A0A067PDH7_9AGAM|nr:hypothetical protein JAAARDRAFT_39821 [Jaapia argillacea MUCL 33604]
MSEDLSLLQSQAAQSLSSTTEEERYGCALLQTLQSQLEQYQTTGGEYLDVIFTHREMYIAHPQGHRCCARGFTDIARFLEMRPWRADRESDAEAVAAFRHEAIMVASSVWKW